MIRVIHFLEGGLPLCMFTREVPLQWPDGHVWAHCGDSDALTHAGMCERCRDVYNEREKSDGD